MPRWPDKSEATQTVEVALPASGSIRKELDELSAIEVHDKPLGTDYADALAFMEEKVTVMIHESSDVNDENPVQLACNGVNQFFFRGQEQDVKRKYVEILARAKRSRISTPEITDGSGARTNAIRKATSLRYPFSVLYDANPKGPSWLKSVMAEAG